MSAPEKILVWDIPTRVFHWLLVCLVVTSWLSARASYMRLHLLSGTTLMALLIFRLAWGIFGSTTARFRDFVTSPVNALRYLRNLSDSRSSAGHNPAGGLMVVTMLATLSIQVITGLLSNDEIEFHGPLALRVSKDVSDRITELHGITFNILMLLIWAHLVAVFFHLLVKRENLIAPMVTGKKLAAHVPGTSALRMASTWAALIWLSVSAALVWWVVA